MPVQIRARQAGHFQCKYSAHVPHRDVRHQGLEVLAARHLCARLTEIPVQRPDRRLGQPSASALSLNAYWRSVLS